MPQTAEELHIAYVGGRVYGRLLHARATMLAATVTSVPSRRATRDGEDEVSEEIVVWGESDSGGGGVDVITLDPWMFEAHIMMELPPMHLPDPGTPGGSDTPPDPCETLASALNSFRLSLAADETALEALDQLIEAADSPQEKKALREEKRQTKDSIREIEAAIAATEAEMTAQGC